MIDGEGIQLVIIATYQGALVIKREIGEALSVEDSWNYERQN
jgi:hypothetical protein